MPELQALLAALPENLLGLRDRALLLAQRLEIGKRLDALAGVWNVNDVALLITAPNPNLKPERSDNYVARLAYYFEPVGNLSVGWFHKEIKDYLVSGQAVVRAPIRSATGSTLTIDQASQRAIIDWKSFNISGDAEVLFRHTGSTASTP